MSTTAHVLGAGSIDGFITLVVVLISLVTAIIGFFSAHRKVEAIHVLVNSQLQNVRQELADARATVAALRADLETVKKSSLSQVREPPSE